MTIKLIFQMDCILRPECNFLNRYFRCLLPVEMVDVEVKVKMMQGIHTFQRDRASQIIKCNPWSTRLHPYPSLIWKMKAYLELEGKLGPKPRPQPQTRPQQSQPTNPATNKHQHPPQNTNPMTGKAPGPKTNDKRRTMLAKRRYKVRVIAQPIPTIPTPTTPINSTAPSPTVATTSTQMPVVRSTAEYIPVMVYQLATGKFPEVPYPTARPQNKGHPSVQIPNPPPLEDIPNAPVRQGTTWPSTGSASKNLFETRKDWPTPSTPTPTPASSVKTEALP